MHGWAKCTKADEGDSVYLNLAIAVSMERITVTGEGGAEEQRTLIRFADAPPAKSVFIVREAPHELLQQIEGTG